jgi:hypothetical protein
VYCPGSEERIHFVSPENSVKFSTHLSLAQALLYSPKALKCIKSITKGKFAYILPGIVSTDDLKLSFALQMPMLCSDPQKQNLYSSKSGCKRIFQEAEVPTPISATDIYDYPEFLQSLTKLVLTNVHVDVWVFKMNEEFDGRGTAYLKLDSIRALQKIRRDLVIADQQDFEQVH